MDQGSSPPAVGFLGLQTGLMVFSPRPLNQRKSSIMIHLGLVNYDRESQMTTHGISLQDSEPQNNIPQGWTFIRLDR